MAEALHHLDQLLQTVVLPARLSARALLCRAVDGLSRRYISIHALGVLFLARLAGLFSVAPESEVVSTCLDIGGSEGFEARSISSIIRTFASSYGTPRTPEYRQHAMHCQKQESAGSQ